MTRRGCYSGIVVSIGIAMFLAASFDGVSARQVTSGAVRIDNDDIGGVVTSAKGPEAGVWVIAEPTSLPTKFVKIVVTDDQGRYLVPDLPKATYSIWVRGYGLVDSPEVQSVPGKIVNLTAVAAPNPRAAAEYYPSHYWYSLLEVPAKSEFPGTGPMGNGIPPSMRTQAAWIDNVKTTSCTGCHQLGNKATREIPDSIRSQSASSVEAWDRRLQSGQDGTGNMNGYMARYGDRKRVLAMFADWTDRIAAGEYPQQAPPRPQGVERNVVITQWDWAKPTEYFHDLISTDKRNPTVNANGSVYGVHENSSDALTSLDPNRHAWSQVTFPTLDENLAPTVQKVGQPSAYWGTEAIWESRTIAHSNTMDHKGRVWNTSRLRAAADNPAFCKEGSTHPSAQLYPVAQSGRQYSVYDPSTKQFTVVDTCFGTFHLNFAHDADNTIWTGNAGLVGWVNTKILDETGDQQKAQGWAPLIVDTNGNGRQDAWVEPDQPLDPAKDKRIAMSFYGVSPSPADGSIWGSVTGFPGAVVRFDPGKNPPNTALAEVYYLPTNAQGQPVQGYSPRGMDVDAQGVVWTVTSSGHLASFDRRKCKGPLNGPKAIEGQHCQEGWSFYPVPGPNFKGNPESASADSNYYNWVDKYNTLGLGENIPIATGNGSGALLALKDGKWVVLRVPYPLGFFAKQIDGRIDDRTAAWKGRGLWTTSGNRTPWHLEGGKGSRPKVLHFQLRPNPLAR